MITDAEINTKLTQFIYALSASLPPQVADSIRTSYVQNNEYIVEFRIQIWDRTFSLWCNRLAVNPEDQWGWEQGGGMFGFSVNV